ncbi:MAG: hypothetical protein ACNA8J_11985 [Gammaproteobacteria bacterium]
MTRLVALLLLAAPFFALSSAGASGADNGWECLPAGGGRLQMDISGDFEAALDWGNEGTRCDGGPRPEGDALRLMFKRDDDALLIVIGITGLARGATGTGLLANVTIVRQGLGLFYGTLGADACVVEVDGNTPLDSPAEAYRVSGRGRCAAGIEAIGRDAEIRIAPFAFTGLAYWAEQADD